MTDKPRELVEVLLRWSDGWQTVISRQSIEDLAKAAQALELLRSATRTAEELLRLRRE